MWFKAHHRNWARQPSDFDQAQWLLDHTALVNERIRNWEVGGFNVDVDVERQNGFVLRGKSATLAGKPDLIAHREIEAVIVDAKTGHDSPSHIVQVMIYLYAVPKAIEQYRNVKLQGPGNLPRPHRPSRKQTMWTNQFVKNLGVADPQSSAADEASAAECHRLRECRFCEITAGDCPARVDTGPETEGGTTDDF